MKTFLVILIATFSAAIGEVLLSYGMKKQGEIDLTVPSQWLDLIMSVVRNPYVLAGVALLAVFFFLYLAALSWGDISYVMPLTAMSFIFVALMAKFVLGEDISVYRWAGTILIVIGIAFVVFENSPEKTVQQGVLAANGDIRQNADRNEKSL
jgi:drug/metabolite transporter (DMT)-like permease